MKQTILRTLAWTALGFVAATGVAVAQAQAAATVASMKGDVRVGNSTVTQNQRILSGSTISTGPGAQLVLKFDDGQQVVLNETTTFKIADFRYRADEPRNDRAVFDLLQGALRFVTGIVGSRNRDVVQLRIPQATIGIRGTDFMVALHNPAFLQVINGAVGATNAAGTLVLGANTVGTVASATSLGVTIPASALPGAVGGAFTNLSAVQLAAAPAAGAAGGAASGAGGAAAAAPAGGAAGVAVGLGVAAGVIGVSSDNSTTTHH
jgi:hypothetical protein